MTDKITKLEFLNKIYSSIAEQNTLKDAFKTLSLIIQENLECTYIDFVLLDEKDPSIYWAHMISKDGFVERHAENSGIIKRCLDTKKTIALEDISTSTEYEKFRENTVSELCVPMIGKKTVVGCINLEFDKKQSFDKDTITLIEIIGKTVGPFIRNMSLHEDVEESEKKFRSLVEHMNEGLWVGDDKHNTTYVNPRFAEMAGLTYEECLKRDCFGFYDEESKQKIHEQHKLRPKGLSSQYELTMINNKGEKIPLLCSGTPIPGGTVGIFTNLTIIKDNEKKIIELSKSEKMLAYITDNSIDGIISVDRNLIIKSWNKGSEKMFGYTKDEVIGQNVRFIIPPEKLKQGELEQIVKITLEKGFLKNFETVRLKKDGKEVNVSMSVTKLTDEKDKFIGFGIIYRDITYQKKAERELQSRFESMQNAYLELGRQRRQMDYLLETLNIAIGDETFNSIDNYIVNAAIMLTKADGATLRIYDKEDDSLNLSAMSGIQPSWWGKAKTPFKGTLAEKAYLMKRPVFVNDIQNNPSYSSPKLAADHGFIAALTIPLYVKTNYIGNITLYSSEKNKLNIIDDSFITNFGKQASLAILTNSRGLMSNFLEKE